MNDADRETADRQFRRELEAIIPQVRAYSRSLCSGDAAQADDLAQETLTKAWAARRSYQLGTNFNGWIYRILRNAFYSDYRHRRRVVGLSQEFAEQRLMARDDQEAIIALDELRQALSAISPEHREALMLIGAAGLTYDEAAEACAIPVGTMKSRLNRARRQLQEALDTGTYGRDRAPAMNAMNAVFAEMDRLIAAPRGSARDFSTTSALQHA